MGARSGHLVWPLLIATRATLNRATISAAIRADDPCAIGDAMSEELSMIEAGDEPVMLYECERCGLAFDDQWDVSTVHGRTTQFEWCDDCREVDSWFCADCDTLFACLGVNGHGVPSVCVNEHDWVCVDCRDNNYTYCEGCDQYLLDYCGCDVEDDYEEDCGIIYSYSYKPDPVFWPIQPRYSVHQVGRSFSFFNDASRGRILDENERLLDRSRLAYFGIELEVEAREGDRLELAEMMSTAFDSSVLYLKEDGSLSRGFEIVTHPRSLDSWQQFAPSFGAALSRLGAAGARAWSESSCGLHVHVSRVAFSGPSHVSRFALLYARNETGFVNVARRSSGYASFSSLRGGAGVVTKCARSEYASHSDAVNLGWPQTVEVRIWRPSLAVGRVLASVEFVHASMQYTRGLNSRDVVAGALEWDEFARYVRDNAATYPHAVRVLDGGTFEMVGA